MPWVQKADEDGGRLLLNHERCRDSGPLEEKDSLGARDKA